MKQAEARTLVIRPGAIGDCLVALPAIESLGAAETWISTAVVPLVTFCPRVFSISSTGLDLLGLPGIAPPAPLLPRLRSFDRIISWYGANRPEFQEAVRALGLPFHFLPALPGDTLSQPASEFYLDQTRPWRMREIDARPRLPLEAPPRSSIVFHPFSGSPRKNWPLNNFRRLAALAPLPVEWTAGPQEELPEATRFDNLLDLARWIGGARLYVGNDSGISHLAAAVGTPVVALFGPTDPAVWAPSGHCVRVLAAPQAKLELLAVEQVLEEIHSLGPL